MAVIKSYRPSFTDLYTCDLESERNLSWGPNILIYTLENGGKWWQIENNQFVYCNSPTSSYTSYALSSSYSLNTNTASYSLTSSYFQGSIESASYALSASYAPSVASDVWTFKNLSGSFTTASATNSIIPGLNFTPQANKRYQIYALILTRTATLTVGPRPGCSFPTGLNDQVISIQTPSSATAQVIAFNNNTGSFNAANTGLASLNTSWFNKIEGMLLVGESPNGNFQITIASETAGTNVTVASGSFLSYREI